MTTPTLTKARVLELLRYDPETYQFVWKWHQGSCRPGRLAGTTNRSGTRLIGIDGIQYPVAKLIWLIEKGWFPHGWVYPANLNWADLRIENLRECTYQEWRILKLKSKTEAETYA